MRSPLALLALMLVSLPAAAGSAPSSLLAQPSPGAQALEGRLELRSAWLDLGEPAGLDPDADPGFTEVKRRRKKGRGKKRGGSLEYGALSGRVAPMNKMIGIGIQLGAPTGVTGKLMLLDNAGLQAGIGAFNGYVFAPTFSVYLDGVFHPHVLARAETFRLSWYVGAGMWMGLAPLQVFAPRGTGEIYFGFNYWGYFGLPWFGTSLGMRLPLGVSLALDILPIEIYGELVPSLLVFPAIGGGLGATVGLRFYL